MGSKLDVRLPAEGGVELGAWLFLPEGSGICPAITMAHGFAATKEHGIEGFAMAFAAAGFVVLVHDHRNFGTSGGEPRGDIDPWRQIADWRLAISYLEARPEVDPTRIGLWGTSYAGGHAIVLGGTDRRLRCVVSQVPTISGYEQGLRRISPDALPALEQAFSEDERARFRGEPPCRQAVVNADPSIPAAYRSQEAIDFYLQRIPADLWNNEVTLRSTRAARMYEPGNWIARVSPTPLLLVVARDDKLTVTDLALAAYERAIAINPNSAEFHSNRGNALYSSRRFQEALASFDAVAALDPQHAGGHYNRGLVLYDLGRLRPAIEAFDLAIALDQAHSRAHFERGNALLELEGDQRIADLTWDLDMPTARNRPISRVRSKIDINMVLSMPTAPTTSATPAVVQAITRER